MYGSRIYLVLAATLITAALPLTVGAQSQQTGITVTTSAEVMARPDVAYAMFGVATEDSTAARAAQENARLTTAVIDAVTRFGIARADIETTQYSVVPVTDYQRTPPVTTGYRVTNLVRVKVRDLTKVGPLIDTAIGAGANNVQGVSFDLVDPSRVQREALAQALRKAEEEARLIADTLKLRLGKVVSVTESGPIIPRPVDFAMARAEAAQTPIIPGQVGVTATVTVVYAIL